MSCIVLGRSECALVHRYNRGAQVRYRVFREEKRTETEFALPADPTGASSRRQLEMSLEHSRRVDLASLTCEHLDYFENGCVVLLVYVEQEERGFRARDSLRSVQNLSTKVLFICLRPLGKSFSWLVLISIIATYD